MGIYVRAEEEDVEEPQVLEMVGAGGWEGGAAEEVLDGGVGDHCFLDGKGG